MQPGLPVADGDQITVISSEFEFIRVNAIEGDHLAVADPVPEADAVVIHRDGEQRAVSSKRSPSLPDPPKRRQLKLSDKFKWIECVDLCASVANVVTAIFAMEVP